MNISVEWWCAIGAAVLFAFIVMMARKFLAGDRPSSTEWWSCDSSARAAEREYSSSAAREPERPRRSAPSSSESDELESAFEEAHQTLEKSIVAIRQALAQAIASEKMTESRVTRNLDQADTWQNRAAMAVQQNNDELAAQALQKRKQFLEAAQELQKEWDLQKTEVETLRRRLADLESEVARSFSQKQSISARRMAAEAQLKTKNALAEADLQPLQNTLNDLERHVLSLEALAGISSNNQELELKIQEILARARAAVDEAMAEVERLRAENPPPEAAAGDD